MKKMAAVIALGIALMAWPAIPVYADASENGCEHSGGNAAGCSDEVKTKKTAQVPEPTSFALLAVGLVAIGGAAFLFGRKRQVQS